MSSDAFSDEAEGLLALELGNWSAIACSESDDNEDCVRDAVFASGVMLVTAVIFGEPFRFVLFWRRKLSLVLSWHVLNKRDR